MPVAAVKTKAKPPRGNNNKRGRGADMGIAADGGMCSPDREQHFLATGSCLKPDELQRVAKAAGVKVRPGGGDKAGGMKATAAAMTAALRSSPKLAAKCGADERCWVESAGPEVQRDLLAKAYRPKMPRSWRRNRREWLTTVDIMNVMTQYERAHAHFKFLGVFPIDFAAPADGSAGAGDRCVAQSMCDLDVRALRRAGKWAVGAVFNLDRHDQSGSHWVACFCDLRPASPKYGACYYDSAGDKPPPEVRAFMRDKLCPSPAERRRFRFKFNSKQAQFKNTECGVFSMVFLILCLRHPDETYRATRARVITDRGDDAMHQQRDVLFRAG